MIIISIFDLNFRMRFLLFLVTIKTVVCQSPDACPFLCMCSNRSVICKGVNIFPTGLPVDLETLVFDVSSFTDFKQNSLKTFKSLKTLRIINSNFTYIHVCSISNLNNLTKIEFKNVQIGEIVSNGFSHLSYVKEIVLFKITVQKMHEYAFNDLTNIDNVLIESMNIANMKNFVFHGWSNIRRVQLKSLTVLSMKPRPFQDFEKIDQLEIIGGTFASSMCGMKGIINTESVKKFKLLNNHVNCSCDSTWMFEIKRNSKDIEVFNNKCLGSDDDVTKLDVDKICTDVESPECSGDISTKTKIHDCRTYTMDEPIIPRDTVHYPEKKDSQNGNGATREKTSHLFLVSLAVLSFYL